MALKNIGQSVGNVVYQQVGRVSSYTQRHRSLPYDVLEDDASYLVVFDTPGGTAEELQVRFVEGSVAVRIDRDRELRDGFEMRFPGRAMTLEGEANLPADAVVDPDSGTARLTEDGTLVVEIPKTDAVDEERTETGTDEIVVD